MSADHDQQTSCGEKPMIMNAEAIRSSLSLEWSECTLEAFSKYLR